MKKIAILLTLTLPFFLHAQTLNIDQSSTYAVVVGISDYQDEGIPDLRFADKDAEAFASFLQSPAGGSLDEDHLKVLLNEEATAAQFAIALDWLWEVVKEDDRVIIYFSGHGDVERKSITQPGYLLCWDSPSHVYMAGGAFNVRDLNDVVSTLSIQNKGKVILITDACRAGKLSGSSIGGSQATAANLAKQFANEIKILSCQPDEYSIEGEQWGGGRGAFSYHLLDGLYGMADRNTDQSVNLMEIRGYLEENVSMEVAPQSQLPMVVGNGREKLTDVFPEMLAQLKDGRKGQMQLFAAIASRGIEDEILAAADSNVVEMYLNFQKAINEKQFLEPVDACAELYYEKLSQEPQLEKLHSSMRRNYAAALQDDAQQVMNIMIKSGLTEQVLKAARFADLYYNYPGYLERAGELLGEEHYMFKILQARKHFFRGLVQKKRKDKRIEFRKALSRQPDMAHAMVYLIRNFEAVQEDSAVYYFQQATEIVPSWVEPYLALAYFYRPRLKKPGKEEEMLNRAGQVDSMSILVHFRKGDFYRRQGKYQLAEKWYLKAIEGKGDICFPCAHLNLGALYELAQRYELAEAQYKKSIQIDSTFAKGHNVLGTFYNNTGRNKEAEKKYKDAIRYDSSDWIPYANLGVIYQEMESWEEAASMTQKAIDLFPGDGGLYAELAYAISYLPSRLEEAKATFKRALELDPNWPDTYFYNAQFILRSGNESDESKSLTHDYLQEAFEKGVGKNGVINLKDMKTREDFAILRKEPIWNDLMQKYFPD